MRNDSTNFNEYLSKLNETQREMFLDYLRKLVNAPTYEDALSLHNAEMARIDAIRARG